MESGKYSTCLITVWYGDYPWWMKYFLRSVEANPEVNWLIVSDHSPTVKFPQNCSLLNIKLSELERLIYSSTGFKPAIKHPYKFCDFKPAYGNIFKEQLEDFDYWGYCDLDMVFGDMSRFLSKYYAGGFDVLSPDKTFFPGHFCIFRNASEINDLYEAIESIQEKLESDKIYMLDEFLAKGGVQPNDDSIRKYVKSVVSRHKNLTAIKHNKVIRFLWRLFRGVFSNVEPRGRLDFNSLLQSKSNELRLINRDMHLCDVSFYLNKKNYWKVEWENGKLIHTKEFLYFHFQLSKGKKGFSIQENDTGFSISNM